MALAVCALFDARTERRLRALERLPDGGPYTLTCQGTFAFARGRAALAPPAVTADLARRQTAVVEAVRASGADLHHSYAPGAWVPHISLATRVPGALLPAVVNAVADVLPMPLVVDRAALVDSGTAETVLLSAIP